MENKEAKGVIVSQEITQKTWPDGKRTNVALITARMEQPTQTLTSQSTGDAEIYGCPFPPGCTE